jgi:broad specificity phosphatase PhoE
MLFLTMTLKNRYFLLRHGEPTWKYLETIYPASNATSIGLSRRGRLQTKSIVKKLRGQKIDLIISSPYRRTKETALIVAKELDLGVVFDKRLVDSKMGIYCGRPKAEYFRDFSKDPKKRFKMRPSGGESWYDVQKRTREFLKSVEKKYQGKNILVVGHGDPLWLLEGEIRGWGNQKVLNLSLIKKHFIKVGELREIPR